MQALRRWVREPLLHFLALGAVLFVLFHWRGVGVPGSTRIVVTSGQVDAITATFARTWQRPPSEQELKEQLDEYVREEIATREAMAIGLDRDDTIIRRRLRQKLEFLVEDSIDASPPTDADLQRWLDTHPDNFRTEAEVAFAHEVVGSSGLRMLPSDIERTSRSGVARMFGEDFADAILRVESRRWTGPVKSGYGSHMVFVRERLEGRVPTLDEVRPQVEREVIADLRRRQLDAMYERLLDRYRIVIEKRAAPSPLPSDDATSATSGAGVP